MSNNFDVSKNTSKCWFAIEQKTIKSNGSEQTLKMSMEVNFNKDCTGENVSMCFEFIRASLNFQNQTETGIDTMTSESVTIKTKQEYKPIEIKKEEKPEENPFNF